MPIDFLERCDTIEESYEFLLAYAGQGLPGDEGGQSNSQVREFLQRAVQALEGLSASCRQTLTTESLEPIGAYEDFVRMLERDAQNSLAAIRIVLAQPSISSQLVDNLNASIHLRALLTDLFLIGEVLQTRSAIPSSQS
jgi:thioredoxin-like negative regulator of GroEL